MNRGDFTWLDVGTKPRRTFYEAYAPFHPGEGIVKVPVSDRRKTFSTWARRSCCAALSAHALRYVMPMSAEDRGGVSGWMQAAAIAARKRIEIVLLH